MGAGSDNWERQLLVWLPSRPEEHLRGHSVRQDADLGEPSWVQPSGDLLIVGCIRRPGSQHQEKRLHEHPKSWVEAQARSNAAFERAPSLHLFPCRSGLCD